MDKLKSAGSLVIGLAVVVGLAMLAWAAFFGMTWITVHVYPVVATIGGWTLIADILLFLPLAIARRTRAASAVGFAVSGWILGLANWMFGFLTTYRLWGGIGVFIGIFFGGVGIVPIGMLAALFHGEWATLGNLVLGTLFWLVATVFGGYLSERSGLPMVTPK